MGGGNGNKAMLKRERNQKLAAKQSKGSTVNQKVAAQKALTTICAVCRAQFMNTVDLNTVKVHAENKHPKIPFSQCFPGWEEEEAAE